MLQQLLPAGGFVFLLAFARLGAILMVMPGIGEVYVSPAIRLSLALALTLAVASSVAPGLRRSSASEAMIRPGVQKPHCTAPSAMKVF